MELVTKLGRSQCGVPSANTIFRSFRPGSLRDSRPKPCRQEPWSKSFGNNSGANWAHSSTNARMRSTSCQISSYCWRIMGMTICLAPRGACGGGVFRSRFTCRVFGRASILASPSLERRRMTKMPPDGYPALQYLHSVRVRNKRGYHASGTVMVRPSRRATLRESLVNFTSATRSSAVSAKMPMPGLQEFRFMFGDQFLNPPQFLGRKPKVPCEPERLQPEFGREIIPVDMDVRRLMRLVAVEIKAIRTGP